MDRLLGHVAAMRPPGSSYWKTPTRPSSISARKELDVGGEGAQYFREDSDLDSLRDDPRFQELLA